MEAAELAERGDKHEVPAEIHTYRIRVEQQQQQIHFLDAGEPGCYAGCYASAPVVTNAQLVLTCFHQAESGSSNAAAIAAFFCGSRLK